MGIILFSLFLRCNILEVFKRMEGEKMTGIELIVSERIRQLEKEGWTAEHDDAHTDGSLAMAAVCFATPVLIYKLLKVDGETSVIDPWPDGWDKKWDRRYYFPFSPYHSQMVPEPGSYSKQHRIDLLVKAGALIAAEIDRLQRREEVSVYHFRTSDSTGFFEQQKDDLSAIEVSMLPSLARERSRASYEYEWPEPSEVAFEKIATDNPSILEKWMLSGQLSAAHKSLAAEMLGKMGGEGSVETLLRLLDDESPLVREGAICGLAYNLREDVVDRLRRVVGEDPIEGVRDAAKDVLGT